MANIAEFTAITAWVLQTGIILKIHLPEQMKAGFLKTQKKAVPINWAIFILAGHYHMPLPVPVVPLPVPVGLFP